jgi:hypothetical protein
VVEPGPSFSVFDRKTFAASDGISAGTAFVGEHTSRDAATIMAGPLSCAMARVDIFLGLQALYKRYNNASN